MKVCSGTAIVLFLICGVFLVLVSMVVCQHSVDVAETPRPVAASKRRTPRTLDRGRVEGTDASRWTPPPLQTTPAGPRRPLDGKRKQKAERRKTDAEMAKLAADNLAIMRNRGNCSEPKPKIFEVQKFHPRGEHRFVPDCVLLHRCSRDCCKEPGSVCSALRKRRVTLYFYVMEMELTNGEGTRVKHTNRVESLVFLNHTECQCHKQVLPPVVRSQRAQGAADRGLRLGAEMAALLLVLVFVFR